MFLAPETIKGFAKMFYKSGILQIILPPQLPETLTSGLKSRVFLDSRMIPEEPHILDHTLHSFGELVESLSRFKRFVPRGREQDIEKEGVLIATTPHGADHLGLLIGLSLNLPVIMFEKLSGGEYGLNSQRIRRLKRFRGHKAMLVDDVLTTGVSSGKVAEFLIAHGITPILLICLMDRQKGGEENLRKLGIEVKCLMTMKAVLESLLIRRREFGKELPLLVSPEEEAVIREELALLQSPSLALA